MLDFIANAFRGIFELLLWINLIAFTIGGGAVGKVLFGGYRSSGHPILGGIIGFLVGMILNIMGAGLVTIFLRIDENMKILVKLNGGKPVEEGVEADNNINENEILPDTNIRKCPFCLENINKDAVVCRFCGKNIQEYDKEENLKKEQEKIKREQEVKEKFKSINDLFNDEGIMEEAKRLGRIYGKGFYVSHLKNKAKELGLGEIDLNKDDIEF